MPMSSHGLKIKLVKMWEANMTMIDKLLAHLLSGQSITKWDAYLDWHLTTLAQRIHDLRERGYPIQSEKILHTNGNYYSRYWLDSNYINAINLQGERIEKLEPNREQSIKPHYEAGVILLPVLMCMTGGLILLFVFILPMIARYLQ